jgi:hypothetical protein
MENAMSAIEQTPINKNFLSPLNFRFQIKKTPYTNFFIQKVNIPAISLPDAMTPTPFIDLPFPGDHLKYGELNITFKVDEDLTNYMEINNWIIGIAQESSFDAYNLISSQPSYTGNGVFSDISLFILASTKVPNYEISFIDAYPKALTDLVFNTTDTDVNYVQASATFKYTRYEINKI